MRFGLENPHTWHGSTDKSQKTLTPGTAPQSNARYEGVPGTALWSSARYGGVPGTALWSSARYEGFLGLFCGAVPGVRVLWSLLGASGSWYVDPGP